MTDTMKWFRRRENPAEEERFALIEELNRTQIAIQQTYVQFNTADDPDLIEATVYELKAHQSRYSYYLRRLKALDSAIEGQLRAQ